MPFVTPGEGLDRSCVNIPALAAELGPPPWRQPIVGTSGLRVILLHWPAGFETIRHHHPHAEEVFQILEGTAIFTIGDEPARRAEPGDFLLAPRGVKHVIRVSDDGPLLMLAAVAPNEDLPDETIEPS